MFLSCHISISSVCMINACISESYSCDVQPNFEAKTLFRADGIFLSKDAI